MAAQLAGETTSVVHFSARSVVYRVPDRRTDGTPRASNKVKRFLRTVILVPYAILVFPVIVVLGMLEDIGIQFRSRTKSKTTVHGNSPSCAALSFADAVRDAEHELSLAWSRSQVALLCANGDHRPEVLWRATGQQCPKLKITKAKLHWPDESSIDFDLAAAERARVTEYQGSP
ncbi:hypothetical protein SAMN04487905_11694 [Actinopolyspora xinjiangensis]|uniref:Uncharacterized protein n=1 Tax=Actinopolyspora xinjiangensis TaxID=405564 RepID=A0A1H0WWB2_9ACTN|nr:hypothetical protein [Actinopolyspora xinjiangensis]SDP94879.1 hypothetical protein SAMN04487905_11694 [Actinopolyspora xinjiangensis]